jgi:hypothetical protein
LHDALTCFVICSWEVDAFQRNALAAWLVDTRLHDTTVAFTNGTSKVKLVEVNVLLLPRGKRGRAPVFLVLTAGGGNGRVIVSTASFSKRAATLAFGRLGLAGMGRRVGARRGGARGGAKTNSLLANAEIAFADSNIRVVVRAGAAGAHAALCV